MPSMSFLTMCFGDINKFVLPFKYPKNELELAVNTHAFEDSEHWRWFLNDLRTLGMNKLQGYVNTLEYLWSKSQEPGRKLTYELIEMITGQPAKMRFVTIEIIEAVSKTLIIWLNAISKNSPLQLEFCGEAHFNSEINHTIKNEDNVIDTLDFDETEYAIAIELIDRGFQAFELFIDQIYQETNAS